MDRMFGRAWAEIHLDRLVKNYYLIKKTVGKKKIMVVIKADAYGHGAIEVAKTLQKLGVNFFGVASAEEGVELRRAGIKSRIVILSPILKEDIDAVIEYGLTPTISDFFLFQELDKRLKKMKKIILVHIEVDTGMTRTGFSYDGAVDAIERIKSSSFIKIEGLFSHFPLVDTDGRFSQRQIMKFAKLIERLKEMGSRFPFIHLANSSGIFRYPHSHFNLVRPGIALYGLNASPHVNYGDGFRPVMSLKSRIVNLRVVPANTPVSYGHTYWTKKRSRIATLSIGYGDGYPRILSNNAYVLCHARRAKIVGAICMDLMMVDVTDIPEAKVGDVVTLIGEEGSERIGVEELAKRCNTIVYEIISGIGRRVARIFKNKERILGVRNLLGR